MTNCQGVKLMKLYILGNNTFWSTQKLANSLDFIYNKTNSKLLHICKRLKDNQKIGTIFKGNYVRFDNWFRKCYLCSNCDKTIEFTEFPEYKTGAEGYS